ncbi:hypothetical protein [Amycolatopsis orientalis]|uniref:hypothetical protein n=1 Tax=Amycolatopsis orientalis TaxID=31958 RepID=UPI0003A7E378|nr:hypothetical protein [Amycolatopsis orientalis]
MDEALDRLLGRSNKPDAARSDRAGEIAAVVREVLALGSSAAVTVQQLACAEPGCPPVETKIAVLGGGGGRRWTLHAPLSELDDDAVRRLLAARPEGENAAR